jgi:hypothetical protein
MVCSPTVRSLEMGLVWDLKSQDRDVYLGMDGLENPRVSRGWVEKMVLYQTVYPSSSWEREPEFFQWSSRFACEPCFPRKTSDPWELESCWEYGPCVPLTISVQSFGEEANLQTGNHEGSPQCGYVVGLATRPRKDAQIALGSLGQETLPSPSASHSS